MSGGWVLILSVLGCVSLVGLIGGIWYLAHYLNDKSQEGPKPKGPEVGTIRIVEKMRKDGSVYYVAERWTHYSKRHTSYGDEPFYSQSHYTTQHQRWEMMTDGFEYETVEGAQEKANAIVKREQEEAAQEKEELRRAKHHKVMGEFKP